ncbi:MAG: efflux RND transporter permease subunit [Armatimonadetes bacterium]|nr:efflux RND transporter permease subunit [Armatimonadota bacterium]
MWLTRLSIQRPVFVIVFMAFFIVLGMRSRSEMNVDLNPKVDIPYVTVTTVYPGAGPEEVETLVSKPLEDAVGSISNVKTVTSYSQYGVSNVVLEFNIGTDLDVAAADVRQKVDAARQMIPTDAEPPVVAKLDINAMPILMMGMTGGRSLRELRYLADTVVKYRLGKVPGVGSVGISGGYVREVRVAVHRERLQAYGLSINDVVNAVRSANLNLPSGRITEGERDYDARIIGEFQSIEELRQLRVPVRQATGVLNLRLEDVADIQDTVEDRSQFTRIYEVKNGKLVGGESVGLTITKLSDANTVQVIEVVKKELADLEKELPGQVHFVLAWDQSDYIKASLEDVNISLILGALLAVLVIFLFLHNLRGTVICAIAIPTSLVAAFIPMHFLGFTMNQMTMLGLSLVVGILVDDSIVVLENIYRHLHRGERPREAAYNGRSEIGLAAITITLVDVVVFVPVAFMGGIVGQFFRQFGLTVAVSTLFSLLVSFTVTPMLASRWYKIGEDVEEKRGLFKRFDDFYHSLDRGYRKLLGWALRHRWTVVFGGVATLGVVLFGLGPRMGFQFFPELDQGRVTVTIELPPGAALDRTDRIVKQVEQAVAPIPEVHNIFSSIGNISGGMGMGVERGRQYAQVNLSLIDKRGLGHTLGLEKAEGPLRTRADQEIATEVRQRLAGIPGARFVVSTVSGFGMASAPIQIELMGFDLNQMARVAEQIRARIAEVEGVRDTDISLRAGKPELQVQLDRVRAAAMGLDLSSVAMAVRNSLDGNTDAKYRERGEEFNIRVQFADFDRNSTESLQQVVIGSTLLPTGQLEPVYLGDIAHVTDGAGPTKIDRKNRMRQVLITGYLVPGAVFGNVQNAVNQVLKEVPVGDLVLEWGGEAEMMQENFAYLFGALTLAVILVYLLMSALFNNLLHPFTIMLSLPMALVGAIAALVITGKSMSIISMIGIIMLVGLVTKNAILLIDYTNTLRSRWEEENPPRSPEDRRRIRNEAIQEAGPTRLRPVLMTTVAMVLGMMPIALEIGRASEMRSPLAVCVIGGLIVSTLLTLVMIPVIYSLLDDFLAFAARQLQRGKA